MLGGNGWKKWLAVATIVALLADRAGGQQPAPTERKETERKETERKDGERRTEGRDAPAERPPRSETPDRARPPAFDPFRGDRRPGDFPVGRFPPAGGLPAMPRDGRPPRPGDPAMPFGLDSSRLDEMKRYDPEMYELEVRDQELESQTQVLAQQLRRAPLNERAELKKQLQELVDKHFDARQTRRELQLKRLTAELEQMRTSLTKRQDSREQIIGRRMAELTGEDRDFDF